MSACLLRQVLYDQLMQHTDAGVAVGEPVVIFDGVAVLAPRGRFEIELYASFMKLLGQVRLEPLPYLADPQLIRLQFALQFCVRVCSCLAQPGSPNIGTPRRRRPVTLKFTEKHCHSSVLCDVLPTAEGRTLSHSPSHSSKSLLRLMCARTCPPLQAQDYRIQYDSIVRLFVLPKSNAPHTLVVVSLDPPIRKGQTYYPHILVQVGPAM